MATSSQSPLIDAREELGKQLWLRHTQPGLIATATPTIQRQLGLRTPTFVSHILGRWGHQDYTPSPDAMPVVQPHAVEPIATNTESESTSPGSQAYTLTPLSATTPPSPDRPTFTMPTRSVELSTLMPTIQRSMEPSESSSALVQAQPLVTNSASVLIQRQTSSPNDDAADSSLSPLPLVFTSVTVAAEHAGPAEIETINSVDLPLAKTFTPLTQAGITRQVDLAQPLGLPLTMPFTSLNDRPMAQEVESRRQADLPLVKHLTASPVGVITRQVDSTVQLFSDAQSTAQPVTDVTRNEGRFPLVGSLSLGSIQRTIDTDQEALAEANNAPSVAPAYLPDSAADSDQLVDKVIRKLLRRLAVEGDRRGIKRWF
ncbi:MAG: hypothetical protein J0M33_11510 [Anaerolineae bacterium]|nr:hypothetical protein [Anaerolineae bacterium]